MNFYRRYPGDYRRDTSALSLAEHGAYCLLLDHCYASEESLPQSMESIYRICSAMSDAERSAVDSVVNRFFPLNGDGTRHNRRVDRQLPEELARIESARVNGSLGGRPRKTQSFSTGLADRNPEVMIPLTQRLTSPSPSPDPRDLSPKVKDLCKVYGVRGGQGGEDPASQKAPKRATQRKKIPSEDEMPLTETMIEYLRAKAPGCNPIEIYGAFRDYHAAHGKLMADWHAAWRTWCRNVRRFNGAGIPAGVFTIIPPASDQRALDKMANELGIHGNMDNYHQLRQAIQRKLSGGNR